MRKRLHQEETAILNKSREKIVEKNINERRRALEKIISEVEQSRAAEELEMIKAESDLVKHYSELLHHKIHLEEALNSEQPYPGPSVEHEVLKKQQKLLAEELEKVGTSKERFQKFYYFYKSSNCSALMFSFSKLVSIIQGIPRFGFQTLKVYLEGEIYRSVFFCFCNEVYLVNQE